MAGVELAAKPSSPVNDAVMVWFPDVNGAPPHEAFRRDPRTTIVERHSRAPSAKNSTLPVGVAIVVAVSIVATNTGGPVVSDGLRLDVTAVCVVPFLTVIVSVAWLPK